MPCWNLKPSRSAAINVSSRMRERVRAAVERRDNFAHQQCMTFWPGADTLWFAARRAAVPLDLFANLAIDESFEAVFNPTSTE